MMDVPGRPEFLHISPKNTPPFYASKWIHQVFLLGDQEIKNLLKHLEYPWLVRSSGLYSENEILLPQAKFESQWTHYLADLARGPIQDTVYKPYFSLFVTEDPKTVGLVEVSQDKFSATQIAPNIIFQIHRFHYSPIDKKFRRLTFGTETVSWGLQASFPMLLQDPKTRAIQKVMMHKELANVLLWQKFQHHLKNCSRPVTFEVDGVRQTLPFRIGYSCVNSDSDSLSWIDKHFELKHKKIQVVHE